MDEDEMYILDKKVKEFNQTINKFKEKNNIDKLILKEKLNDLLGQFEVCLKGKRIPKKYSRIISAIKYPNNIKKHSESIFKYSLSTLNIYPSNNLYPSSDLHPSKFKIWWNELPLDNPKFENQYNCYNDKLLNKDLLKSINEVYKIVKEVSDHYNR